MNSIHVDLFILQRKFVNFTIYILIVKFTELEYCPNKNVKITMIIVNFFNYPVKSVYFTRKLLLWGTFLICITYFQLLELLKFGINVVLKDRRC